MESLHSLPSFVQTPFYLLTLFLAPDLLSSSLSHHVFLLFRAPSSDSHYSLCKAAKPPPVSSTYSSLLSHLSRLSCDLFLLLLLSQACPGNHKFLAKNPSQPAKVRDGGRQRNTNKPFPAKPAAAKLRWNIFPAERAKRFYSL